MHAFPADRLNRELDEVFESDMDEAIAFAVILAAVGMALEVTSAGGNLLLNAFSGVFGRDFGV